MARLKSLTGMAEVMPCPGTPADGWRNGGPVPSHRPLDLHLAPVVAFMATTPITWPSKFKTGPPLLPQPPGPRSGRSYRNPWCHRRRDGPRGDGVARLPRRSCPSPGCRSTTFSHTSLERVITTVESPDDPGAAAGRDRVPVFVRDLADPVPPSAARRKIDLDFLRKAPSRRGRLSR